MSVVVVVIVVIVVLVGAVGLFVRLVKKEEVGNEENKGSGEREDEVTVFPASCVVAYAIILSSMLFESMTPFDS